MKNRRLMFTLAIAAYSMFFAGCSNEVNIYDKNQQKLQDEVDKLVEQCNNFKEINVELESNVSGMFCSIYTENPYDDNGSLKIAPVLSGLTPINTTLSISKGVDNLYIVSSKGVLKRDVKDLKENLSTATRSVENSTISDELSNEIDKAFPENQWNLRNQDLYFNTDLKLKEAVDISITYVSDGLGKCDGTLYMYTYPADVETPTIDQCTFYGIDQTTNKVVVLDGVPEIPNIKLKKEFVHPLSVSNYIFSNVEDKKLGHRKADMGIFNSDVKIGFCYVGIYDCIVKDPVTDQKALKYFPHYSFTTPCLNDASHSLNKPARNDASFHYTEPTTQGCIKKIECEGKIYFVLGIENSLPDGASYDADFNDMLCVMELNPDIVETVNTAPNDIDLETYKYTRGYYLFEDNYPNQGDYDFNDVVVQYEIKTYVNRPAYSESCNEVKVALLACGCNYNNEFGFYVGDKDNTENGIFYPVFKNIQGYVNVDRDHVGEEVDPSKFKYSETMHFAGTVKGTKGYGAMLRPYLKNENGIIYDNSFCRDGLEYPYVLDVPLESTTYNYTLGFNYTVAAEAGKGFRWCTEGKRLDAAYNETPKTSRWYLNGYKDESLLIKREATAN